MSVDRLAQGQHICNDIFVLRRDERTLCAAAQGAIRKAGQEPCLSGCKPKFMQWEPPAGPLVRVDINRL